MFGSATFTTVASSTTMSCATQITARASPPLRVTCECGASVMGFLRVGGRGGSCRTSQDREQHAADDLLGIDATGRLAGHECTLQHERGHQARGHGHDRRRGRARHGVGRG